MEQAALTWDRLYHYLIPEHLCAAPGQRVRIPFGNGNRRRTGLVVETGVASSRPEELKPIDGVVDAEPLLNAEGIALLKWLRENTFCTWFDAYRLLVPAGLGLRRRMEYTAVRDSPALVLLSQQERQVVEYIAGRKKPAEQGALQKRFSFLSDEMLADLVKRGALSPKERTRQTVRDERVVMVRRVEEIPLPNPTAKQRQVLAFLEEAETASLREICYHTGCTRAVPDALARKGVVEYFDQHVLRDPYAGAQDGAEEEPDTLSDEQQAAFEQLTACMEEVPTRPALLYGVTGSGKTLVYLRLIEETLARGQRVILLVPEISLTAQLLERFHRRFGDRVAVLHSSLSLGERMDGWRRIRAGGADIVIGTRSAVFAPLEHIGLIILDEEQEHTYHSDRTPRYHARDVARLRCANHNALLLLSSATPSVESYHRAKRGSFTLVTLPQRFGDTRLPDVYIVDMREAEHNSASPMLSSVLLEELSFNLAHGEQSILLLNRRGHSTQVRCSGCGETAACPHCSVALTYHAANGALMCHYCGYRQDRIKQCPQCGSELVRYAGAGTQKIAQELEALYPQARILRVDTDTTMTRFSHETLFAAFEAGEYDIMIGTQMVAKGLNFPAVTLVGVLNADQALYAPDFRSAERAFSLLTQVAGRAGRGEQRGRALIQTFNPDHPVIPLAAAQDYPAFFEEEIQTRRHHLYPPFCTMAAIGFTGPDEAEVRTGADAFLEEFRRLAAQQYASLPVRLLGPAPADIPRVGGKYRYRLILKCKNTAALRELLHRVLLTTQGGHRQIHIFIDMHYDRM